MRRGCEEQFAKGMKFNNNKNFKSIRNRTPTVPTEVQNWTRSKSITQAPKSLQESWMNTGGDEAQCKQGSAQLVPHLLGQEGTKWQQLLVVKACPSLLLGKVVVFSVSVFSTERWRRGMRHCCSLAGIFPGNLCLIWKKQRNRIWNKSINNSK